jgi:histidine triad (HIT) family protein
MKNISQDGKKFVEEIKEQKCFLCDASKQSLVTENDNFLVLLDAYPSVFGHVICAPKEHVISLSALSEDKSKELILLTRKIDKVLRKLFSPFRVAIVSSGLAVEHFHFHIIPVPNEEMMWDFKYLRKDKIIKYSEKEKIDLTKKIRDLLIV